MVHYESLFFYEIKNNSWYLLVKMGHNPAIMIFAKLLALLLSVTSVYSIGFFFTAFLTFFLKYNLIVAYFPSLYITGLIDLIIISMISMALSLFGKTITNARYSIFMSVAVLHILKVISGHYSVLSNRVSMQSLVNLVDLNRTLYVPIAFAVISICSYIWYE